MVPTTSPRRTRFPWLPLLILLATAYLFWVMPRQMGDHPVKVEFEDSVQQVKR